jgi:hypothetical protein
MEIRTQTNSEGRPCEGKKRRRTDTSQKKILKNESNPANTVFLDFRLP